MDITCQYCGTVASSDRVMCPNCKRRMQPAGSAPNPTVEPPDPPPSSEPPPWQPPGYYPPAPDPAAAAPGYPPQYPPPGYPPQPTTQWYPLQPQHGPWGGPLKPPILFDRAATTKVSRLSVGFRLILAIPAFVVAFFLVIAQLVVGIAAWLAAVFTARVPVGLYNFTGYVVGYNLRVNSYVSLLTDKWPTLSSRDPYPVVIRYPGPERLNRAAVIFRLILFVPAYVLTGIVGAGLVVVLFPIWLITLFAGRVMNPIFDAVASVIRYQTRVTAYLFLLTSAYPSQLFVDAHEDQSPQVPGRPELLPPRRSTGARRLLIAIIVLGVISQAVQFTFRSLPPIRHLFRDFIAEGDLSDAYDNVDLNLTATCPNEPGQLRCLQADATVKANELRLFDSKVAGLDVGSSSKPYVAILRTDTQSLITDYQRLIEARTLAGYRANAGVLPTDIGVFEEAEQSLDNQLLGN